MRRRAPVLTIVALLIGMIASPVVLPPAPAAAHGPYGSTPADNTAADISPDPVMSDGTPMKVRVLRPNATKPQGGWPLMIYLHGDGGLRCWNMAGNLYDRTQLASDGFVVLSFNARGMQLSEHAHECGTTATDAVDGINDSGNDWVGPRDMQDISDLITWAINNYAPAGCSSPCINSNQIGVMGFSYGAMRAWMIPLHDSRVKAVVPVASGLRYFDVSNISNKPTDIGNQPFVWPRHIGSFAHNDPAVLEHMMAMQEALYLNQTVPTATQAWWDARTLVDDDNNVDKAHLINTPVFAVQGFLDSHPYINNLQVIEAWKKVPGNNKYLYLGSCTHDDPCGSNNRAAMRSKIHRFLDYYVRGDTSQSVGGPVFFTVPPPNPFSNPDNWTEQTANTWPPPLVGGAPITLYLHNNGVLSTTAPGVNEPSATIANNLGSYQSELCASATYTTGEYKQYETGAATVNVKLVKVQMDLWLSSDTTRLQTFADLFDVAADGTETRIWRGAINVPTARSTTANTPVNFVFQPGGQAWTWATGHKLRVKITSSYKALYAQEPLPATYTIYHDSSKPAKMIVSVAT